MLAGRPEPHQNAGRSPGLGLCTFNDHLFTPGRMTREMPFEEDWLERQLGVFAEEEPQTYPQLTDEEVATALRTLNQYPYLSF